MPANCCLTGAQICQLKIRATASQKSVVTWETRSTMSAPCCDPIDRILEGLDDDDHGGAGGDWHGDVRRARAFITDLAERGIALILHLGDFGIWPGPTGEKTASRPSRTTTGTPT